LRCCATLRKTQYEIENEYTWVDLPDLIRLEGERRARDYLDDIEVSIFPHVSDKDARETIIEKHRSRIPKPTAQAKTADEQYQALLLRMRGGI